MFPKDTDPDEDEKDESNNISLNQETDHLNAFIEFSERSRNHLSPHHTK